MGRSGGRGIPHERGKVRDLIGSTDREGLVASAAGLFEQGAVDDALAALARGIEISEASQRRELIIRFEAMARGHRGQPVLASAVLERCQQTHPSDLDIGLARLSVEVSHLDSRRRREGVQSVLATAIGRDGDNMTDSTPTLGRAPLAADSQLKGAMLLAEAARRSLSFGLESEAGNYFDEALSALGPADPLRPGLLVGRANIHAERGNVKASVRCLEEALDLEPAFAPARALVAEHAFKNKAWRDCFDALGPMRNEFSSLTAFQPARLWWMYGVAGQQLGELSVAEHAFSQILALEPKNAKAQERLMALYASRIDGRKPPVFNGGLRGRPFGFLGPLARGHCWPQNVGAI